MEVDVQADEPDWDQISAEQFPPDLVYGAAALHKKQNTPCPRLETLPEAFSQNGFYLFVFVFLLAFGEAYALDEALSPWLQDIFFGLLLGSVLCFVLHISLLMYIKITTWEGPGEDLRNYLKTVLGRSQE